MHELGIVTHVIKSIQALGEEQGLKKVHSVTLEIGEVSGVLFDYLDSCWEWSVKKEGAGILQDSILKCETIPAVTVCEDCRETYSTVKYGKMCPFCKGGNTFLVTGDELNIKEIEAV